MKQPKKKYPNKRCQYCNRFVRILQTHHIIPKLMLRRMNYKKRKELRRTSKITVRLCRDCHRQIHSMFTNKELKNQFNDMNKITETKEFKKYLSFIVEKPEGTITHAKRRWKGGKFV